jgi:hypothetical protein
MPEMSDEEKAARLAFYKEAAQAQWDDRDRALMDASRPLWRWERIQIYVAVGLLAIIAVSVAILGATSGDYWGLVAVLAGLPLSFPILRLVRRGDVQPVARSDWKRSLLSLLGVLLWLVLIAAVCAVTIVTSKR